MRLSAILLALFIAIISADHSLYGDDVLAIGSFNVQIFGLSKVSQSDVVSVLVDCFRRWDVALIMEIRDASNTAIYTLLNAINDWDGPTYGLVVSEPLGRTSSKESYGFIYRTSRLLVLDNYTYNDVNDVFEREPHPTLFKSTNDDFKFFIVPLHSKPTDTVNEINHLKDVFIDAQQRFGVHSGIIMGDLNAGCSYLPQSQWPNVSLRSDPDFQWLIGDDVDTTTGATRCAYDRFIISSDLTQSVYPDSASVFRFDTALSIDSNLTTRVSDHYPIEFGLIDNATTDSVEGGLTGGEIAAIVICLVLGVPALLIAIWIVSQQVAGGEYAAYSNDKY